MKVVLSWFRQKCQPFAVHLLSYPGPILIILVPSSLLSWSNPDNPGPILVKTDFFLDIAIIIVYNT